MATIEVEGKQYKVVENLGYQAGHYAKAVETEQGERIAVRRGFAWTWWTAQDRIQPRGLCVGMSNHATKEPAKGAGREGAKEPTK